MRSSPASPRLIISSAGNLFDLIKADPGGRHDLLRGKVGPGALSSVVGEVRLRGGLPSCPAFLCPCTDVAWPL